ncbi:E3 ubiquitin-protein ligase HUWE1-like isoform X5 [Acropora muricata]|uniref:E3 ubiquitin-protein ligase HUWE1-like isoform X5 n=1 Tax=Acropora muricata TaxID=159855 RepID=UPI0034E52550
MKIDRSKLRKTQSDVAPECRQLIQRLRDANDVELIRILKDINTWYYGKCELQHWVDVMDKFDEILASVAKPVNGSSWILAYDKLDQLEGLEIASEKRCLVNHVLRFTALVLEHSYTRHLYNSIEHLVSLLVASDMEVVLSVLGVLYVFSKRSSFIPRLPAEKRKAIQQRLQCLGETWGGKNAGFGLGHCCQDLPIKEFPSSCGDVYFEFYNEVTNTPSQSESQEQTGSQLCSVHVKQLYQFSENPGEIMEQVITCYSVPTAKQVNLFSRIRLAKHFPVHAKRLQCIQARLQAISVLLYSNSTQDVVNPLLYQGFIEETVELLELDQPQFSDIRTAAIRTLTALVHMECSPRVNTVIDCTGLASYHGFLPTLTRNCIQALTERLSDSLPLPFATGLFSFLYHLAYYEVGAEALVSCGLLEALLRVVEHQGGDSHLTFVTRAIRIMEWIANMDLSGYQNQSGLTAIISRLEQEIKKCLPYHGAMLSPDLPSAPPIQQVGVAMETSENQGAQADSSSQAHQSEEVPMETEQPYVNSIEDSKMEVDENDAEKVVGAVEVAGPSSAANSVSKNRCLPQRAALIKAVLSFLKKSIPDPSFSESIRNVMDSSLPTSLKHIISNVEYYGPVLFMAAIDVVTVYVFHEPSLLSSLQDNGLTGVMLKALVVKEVPATREVLSSLPSVLSALCLNTRGLQAFMSCKPFDKLFRVLLSPDYLPAMRRRRTSESLGETASNLGTAMDELMRHQPTLKTDAMKAIIKLLQEVCSLGQDSKYIGFKMGAKTDSSDVDSSVGLAQGSGRSTLGAEEPMSDEEEDDEDRFSFTSTTSAAKVVAESDKMKDNVKTAEEEKRTFIPLMDYIFNVVRFVDSILSNNSTDDHCREFVRLGGLEPLITILGLPNLPLDFVSSPACQSVSGVCKSVLMLSHEAQVLKQGLTLLRDVLKTLEPLIARSSESPVCLLLHEVASSGRPQQAMASVQLTPLLHGIVAAHAYISMFLHVCKVGQFDIRSLCVNHWGSDQGVAVLKQLGQLYMFLIWETIVLEAISKAETAGNSETQIAAEDLEMLKASTSCQEDSQGQTHEGNSAKLPTNDKESKSALPVQQRIIKQLLQTSTSLGRALSDLFVLLVKLSVGSAQRQRRAPHPNATPGLPTLPARFIAFQLTKLLKEAFSWQGLPSACSVPKPRLHFHMCVVGLTSRMLFDDKKNPYHLMLQQFMMSGAHSNLFLLMKMILHKEVKTPASECIGQSLFDSDSQELVDSWLTLVSRLVNSDTLMDSPHALPATSTQPGFVPFKPIDFLVSTQKKAYFAVQLLWGKKLPKEYGPHLAESMLVVLYHIIKGEAVIKEKLGPTPESSGTSSSSAAARAPVETAPQPEINMQHLQQFMDMGFTHEAARLALLNTGSLEEATDYILNHPHAPPARELGLDFDMFEEDQMMRAIAMSLGQDVPAGGPATEHQASPVAAAGAAAAAAAVAASSASSQNTTASDSTVISANTSKVVNKEKRNSEEQTSKETDKEKDDKCPLEKSELDQFTSGMLHGCLEVLTEMPSTVFKACDVLSAVAQRNGEEWKEKTMIHILQQVTNDIQSVLKLCSTQNAENRQVEGSMAQMSAAPEAARLSSLLHLTCLLFEEKKFRCEATIEKFGILTSLLELLEVCQTILLQSKLTGGKPNTPAWLSPLLLFLDTHEKMAVTTRRKELHDKRTTHAWKWFDDRSGRWYNYNVNNNTTIDAAYRSGESGVRFMAGRRRYSVNFATMVQENEDSGNRRPIMLETASSRDGPANSRRGESESSVASGGVVGEKRTGEDANSQPSSQDRSNKNAKKDKQDSNTSDVGKSKKEDRPVIQHLNDEQKSLIVRCCTGFIGIPVSPNTLQAVLKLCLRLTQEHKLAVQFVDQGGARALLVLTQDSAVSGFTTLATLLLRHVLEDEENLKHTMEKVVRSAATSCAGGGNNTGVSPTSPGAKEINYVLRVLGPAACRNAELFKEVATNSLRLAVTPQLRRTMIEGGDSNLPSNYAQIVKAAVVAKIVKAPPVAKQVHGVICDLLNVLCASDSTTRTMDRGIFMHRSDSQMLGELGRALGQVGDMLAGQGAQQNLHVRQLPAYQRQLTGEDVDVEEMALDSSQNSSQSSSQLAMMKNEDKKDDVSKNEEVKESNQDVQTPVKPLLSKSAILKLLAELVKSYSGVAQLITDYNHSAKLSSTSEYEGPILAFIFDQLLPSGPPNDNDDTASHARTLLSAIATCHQAPEAQQCLVTEMKASLERALTLTESACKHSRLQSIFTLVQHMIDTGPYSPQPTVSQPNSIMKLLLKKGLVNDLARVPHSLDLASPNFVATINCVLKPLEKLSGVVNQPSAGGPFSAPNKERPAGSEQQTTAEQGTTTLGERSLQPASAASAVVHEEPSAADSQADNPVANEHPWTPPEITGRGIIPMASEEELEELQDMVDELLNSDGNDNQSGQDLERETFPFHLDVESNILAEHVISRHMADGRMVDDATYVIDPISSDSSDSSDDGSGGEDVGEESEDDGGDIQGDNDNETMVVTFEDSVGQSNAHDEDDDGDDDDDEDDEDEEEDEEEDIDGVAGQEGAVGLRQDGVMESSGGVDVMEEEEVEEEEEDENDEDDHDEEDDEGGSDMDEEGADIIDEDSLRIYEEEDLYLPFDEGSGRHLEWVSEPHDNRFAGTFMMTVSQDEEPETITSMAQRLSRVHGLRVTSRHHSHQSQPLHTSHHQGVSQPPLPTVVQSLLGPESTTDAPQFSSGISHRSRHLQDEIQVIARNAEGGANDDLFFENLGESSSTNVPSALSRWAEEGQILDAHGVHYCAAAVKPEILPVLLKLQADEIAKGREEEQKKKADAQAKAAAAKKEEEKKKQESSQEGGESSAAVAGEAASGEPSAAAPDAAASPVEGMQVELQATVQEPDARTPEQESTEDPTVLVSMSMDEPVLETSASSEMVRASTPANESREPSAPPETITPPLPPRISSVVQDILSAAALEASGQNANVGPPELEGSNDAHVSTSEDRTGRDTGHVENDGSPMALGDEGTGAAARSDAAQNTSIAGAPQQTTAVTTDGDSAAPSTAPDSEQPGTSGEASALTIDGIPIPDGVDPSFLEALPEAIRREVLAEQLGLHPPSSSQRIVATNDNEGATDMNVSPEFLAALPPEVQEEVLQQQRIEQERRRNQTATPEQAVDPGTFLRTLAPSLRQTVLADIDDSLLPLLPTDLASEAQTLRREIEARHHRILQERFTFSGGDRASAISALLRHSALSRHGGGSHFSRLLPSGGGLSGRVSGFSNGPPSLPPPSRKIIGRHLLDHEALACLLVLLFVEEPRLNTGRLHKVLRNLCYHEETRSWLINAMIAILRRTSGQNPDGSCPVTSIETSTRGELSSSSQSDRTESLCRLDEYLQTQEHCASNSKASKQHSWLSFGVRTSLGSRTNVFCIKRQGKAGLERSTFVSIHPHASQFVWKHVLDALLFLAKSFPASFTPFTVAKAHPSCTKDASSSSSETKPPAMHDSTDFWDILLKLDTAGTGRKGKGAAKSSSAHSSLSSGSDSCSEEVRDFAASPIGQLLIALADPVVQDSTVVTDKLLRLLSVTSAALPDMPCASSKQAANSDTPTSAVTVPPETLAEAPVSDTVTPSLNTLSSVTVTVPGESVTTPHLTAHTPSSETESVASSLIVERSSEAGGEPHEVESLDESSVDESSSHPSETSSQPGVVEPMVVEVTPPPDSQSQSSTADSTLLTATAATPVFKQQLDEKKAVVMEGHLRLVVDVLTSGTCSEEGLEDATTLLLQISRLNSQTRDSVLQLLLEGARRIGEALQKNIALLLNELIEHNRNSPPKDEIEVKKDKRPATLVLPAAPRRPTRGGHQAGWVNMPSGSRGARRQQQTRQVRYDLHLPSMPALTCKTSSQALLLRVLKVILQLREAARRSSSGATTLRTRALQRRDESSAIQRVIQGSRGLGAVIAAIESEAEAIYEAFTHMRSLRSDPMGDHGRTGGQRNEQGAHGESSQDRDRTEGSGQEGGSSQQGASTSGAAQEPQLPLLSEQITLEELWETLGECLSELGRTSDSHAVLVLQPAVEAFFLVHGTEKQESSSSQNQSDQHRAQSRRLPSANSAEITPPSPGPLSPGPLSPSRQVSVTSVTSDLPSDTLKFLRFAEKHRTVLNQILRQSTVHLADGPFAVLVDHTRVLDFDVKRRFFRQELERLDEGIRRDDLTIHVRREHVFEDSFRELHRRSSEEMKCRLYVVFEGEEGQDAGGLLREWFMIMAREMFNPNYALFTTSPGDRVTYQPNASSNCNSNHLSYFKFVGRIVAKAIYDNKLLDCFFTRSFYKHILGKTVHFTDLESFDYAFYQGLRYLLEHDLSEIDTELTFSAEVQVFGLSEVRDLIPNGRHIAVTEENKKEYVKLVCQMKMTGAIRKQIDSFLEGFYEIIPKRLISIFDEQELELLISGLPNIDLDDLKANTEYHKYTENSLQIQWFWRALRSFDQADRAKFLQFVTGTSKVPLQGFAALEGMNGFQKFQIHRDDRSTDRLPSAHTCFNQLDLPAYETYDKLRSMLNKAVDECPEGFGLA